MNLYVVVRDGKNKTYNHRAWLNKQGLQFKRTGKYKGGWFLVTTDCKIVEEIELYCKEYKLLFIFYNQDQKRSATYREVFYSQTPAILDKYYFCVYCMLPHKKENITVDHIIPIKKSRTSKICKWLMKKKDITNINDYKNLVAACKHCNSKKGAKGGLWILRGFLGKSNLFILLCYFLFISWVVVIIGIVLKHNFLMYL